MKWHKIYTGIVVSFAICWTHTSGTYPFWGSYGFGAVAAPAFLPVYIASGPSRVPFILFLKLMAVNRTLRRAKSAIAIGSLAVGAGGGLLAGKLSAIAILKALNSKHHAHPGFGWEWEPRYKHGPHFIRPPIPVRHTVYVRHLHHEEKPIYRNAPGSHKTFVKETWAPHAHVHLRKTFGQYQPNLLERVMAVAAEPFQNFMSSLYNTGGAKYKRSTPSAERWKLPGFTPKESEQFLEHHFLELAEKNPEIARSLVPLLRKAYSQTLTDLTKGLDIPKFIPMPLESNQSASALGDTPYVPLQDIDVDWALEQIPEEVKTFFTFLSAFDSQTCFQKLVCDIHTRVDRSTEVFTEYERNVISLFRMLKIMYRETQDDLVSAKYMDAARFGEDHGSPTLCREIYPDCQYSPDEIMEMGQDLDSSSSFSIPDYIRNKIGTET